MRWLLAMVFGVIGGVVGYAVFGEPNMGGALGNQIAFFATGLGIVLAAPIGFLIGSLPIFSPKPAAPEQPPKRLSPQVTGMKCVVCGETIIFAGDGKACPQCESVFHLACTGDEKCPSCG